MKSMLFFDALGSACSGRWVKVGLLAVPLAIASVACGGDDSAPASTGTAGSAGSAGAGGGGGTGGTSGGTAGSSVGGTAGSGGTGVVGADGGTPEGGVVTKSKPGMDLVAGGTFAHSANFTLIMSLGESPGGNGLAKSSLYQIRGGLVSTTQKR